MDFMIFITVSSIKAFQSFFGNLCENIFAKIYFQLIASWCHHGCLATGPLVKDCKIKVSNTVDEPLKIQYQEQFRLTKNQ